MKPGVVLRPARPDRADGLVFAQYLDQAADGMFDLMLGSAAPEIIASAFAHDGHDLSSRHVTIAEIGHTPVGMISAYTAADHAQSSDRYLEEAAGWRTWRLALVSAYAHRLLRFMSTLEDGAYYVQAVGVDPTRQGHGIGTALLDHARTEAARHGATHLALDVAQDNPSAKRLYERLGYDAVATSPPIPLIANSRVDRMVRPINSP